MERGADFIMLFKPEFVPKIINKQKTQTRRFVKPTERFNTRAGHGPVSAVVNDETERVRFEIGKDYSVQPGRGKAGLWYCPKCLRFTDIGYRKKGSKIVWQGLGDYTKFWWKLTHGWAVDFLKKESNCSFSVSCKKCKKSLKPLRIRITKIRKEKFLDISLKDAKAEGFENRFEFWKYVCKLAKIKYKGEFLTANPWMWVLNFEIKKNRRS